LVAGPKDQLISSDIWRCRDDEEFHLFRKITRENYIEKGSGWLGKVFQTGSPAWIKELPADKEYKRNSGLQGLNIRSGIAFPIFIGEEVAAIMEFYSPKFYQPDPALLTVMAHIGTQLGRIIERDQAKRKILQVEKSLRELAARLVKSQEDERKRIAHELHDGVGQSMIALQMSLNMLASELEGDALIEELDQARKVTRQIVEGMQELSYELRPPELEIMGLDAALQDACQNFAKKADFGIHYRGTKELPVNISDIIQLSFYRALQEALANIAQHAKATQVNVQFSYEDGQISLLVADNGKGLPEPAKVVSGLGLIELTERFVRLGGSLRIGSQENNGTTLTVAVPWVGQEFC
jgi:signal transduction histidine kinase